MPVRLLLDECGPTWLSVRLCVPPTPRFAPFGTSNGGLKAPRSGTESAGSLWGLQIDLPIFLDQGVLRVAFAGYGRHPTAVTRSFGVILGLDV